MKIKKYFDIYYKDMIVNHNHSVKDIVENSKMASLIVYLLQLEDISIMASILLKKQ